MKILCVFGKYNYGNPERGLGYEYTNFLPTMKHLGHEVLFFECWNKSCYRDFSDMNRKLLQMVDQEKPDLIFFVLMTYEIWLEALQLIREGSNASLICWATDDSWKYEQFSRFMGASFDLYATTYPSAIEKSRADGMDNFTLTQWAAESSRMSPPLPSEQCRYPVSFVGSAYGNRISWIEQLKKRGIEVTCFGHGWSNGPVDAEEIPRILRASQISLNFGDSGVVIANGKPVRSRQIKARVFEVPGAGGLLFTEPADGLENFYQPDKEIIVFDGIDNLVEKVRHILAHSDKRDAIAQAGYAKTVAEHGYESRFSPLLEQALECRKGRASATGGINFDAFEAVARLHRPSWPLHVLKVLLLLPCTLLWGKERGPRAARRFLFEFSWRFLGRKSYMATGWAGRLFYHES